MGMGGYRFLGAYRLLPRPSLMTRRCILGMGDVADNKCGRNKVPGNIARASASHPDLLDHGRLGRGLWPNLGVSER